MADSFIYPSDRMKHIQIFIDIQKVVHVLNCVPLIFLIKVFFVGLNNHRKTNIVKLTYYMMHILLFVVHLMVLRKQGQ